MVSGEDSFTGIVLTELWTLPISPYLHVYGPVMEQNGPGVIYDELNLVSLMVEEVNQVNHLLYFKDN